MKTNRNLIHIWLLVAVMLPAVAQSQFTFTTNTNNTITITGYTGPGGNVTIPATLNGYPVTSIGTGAFYNQITVTGVIIPYSVTNIGDYPFDACSGLTNIAVDVTNLNYASASGVLFNKSLTTLIEYPGGLTESYDVPNSVTNIGDYAFFNCSGLTNLTMGSNVTTISYGAFVGSHLSNVTIGSGVRSFGDAAFFACDLTSVTIPNSVTNIGRQAFGNCPLLNAAYFEGSAPTVGGGPGSADYTVFVDDYGSPFEKGTVYYLPGTTGWGSNFGGWPTVAGNVQSLLTFDDLPAGGPLDAYPPVVPNGFGGLNWGNFCVENGLEFSATTGDGYYYGVVSTSNVVFNLYGYPASISSSNGLFDLDSAYVTSALNSYPTLNIQVEGFVGATMVYFTTYTVTNGGPTLINFDYIGVDSVTFTSGQVQFVMDNVTITEPSASTAPPAITAQPESIAAFLGSTAQLMAGVSGTTPLAYQWHLNGTNVNLLSDSANFTGANSNILTILNVTTNDAGSYQLTVTNLYGTAFSSNASLFVVAPKLVGEWLTNNSLADVSGYSPPGTHDGYDIGNAGGNYYFTNDVPPGESGYSLYLTNDGIAINNSSTLDANYTNTFDDTIHNAMTVAFWARGWPSGWTPWVSKNGDAAGWQFRAGEPNFVSPCWTIQGTGYGAIPLGTLPYNNPADLVGTNTFGNDGKWHVYVGTYSALTGIRKLYVDGVLSGQETGNGLYALAPSEHVCIGAEERQPGGNFVNFFTGEIYDVRISNYDWNTNEVAAYSALPDPLITAQPPSSITGYVGGNTQISVGVSGTNPLTNQWQFNGTNLVDGAYGGAYITGSTSNVLTITDLTTNLQGSYHLVVSNTNGMTVSSNAILTVTPSVAPPAGNLVGEWLNGSTNFADVSGYSPPGTHDGYIVGSTNCVFTNDVPFGKTGQSLFFYNGDTGITISNSSTLDANYTNTFDDQINNAFTVSFWAKGWPTVWSPWVSKWGDFASYPDYSTTSGWQLRSYAGDPYACFTVRDNNSGGLVFGNTSFDLDDLASSYTSNDGGWHFYMGAFDATTGIRSLYVDGELAGQETNNVAYTLAAAEHLVIGGKDSPPGNSFGNFSTFEIYDVRIYNYALTIGGCIIPYVIIESTTNVQSGQTVQLSVGGGSGSFGWTSNGVAILGAFTNSLTVTNVTVSATYTCYATNQCDESYPVEFFFLNVVPVFSGRPVLNGNQAVLTWSSGTLLEATNLAGPWTPVAGATSPYTNNVTAAPQMFFKLQ